MKLLGDFPNYGLNIAELLLAVYSAKGEHNTMNKEQLANYFSSLMTSTETIEFKTQQFNVKPYNREMESPENFPNIHPFWRGKASHVYSGSFSNID